MYMSLQARYLVKREGYSLSEVVCFTHAVQCSMKGYSVETEIDDFTGSNECRTTACSICCPEYSMGTNLKEEFESVSFLKCP